MKALLAFALMLAACFFLAAPCVDAATINVPGDYSNITAAVAAASSGDTINITADVDLDDEPEAFEGLYLTGAEGLTFEGNGNTLTCSLIYGIDLHNSANLTFQNFIFDFASVYMVAFSETSHNITIISCTFAGSSAFAFYLVNYEMTGLNITGCTFTLDGTLLNEGQTINSFDASSNYYSAYTGDDTDGDGVGEEPFDLTGEGAYVDASPFTGHYRFLVDAAVTVFEVYSETDAITGAAWDSSTGKLNFTCPNDVTAEGSNGLPVTQFWVFNNGSTFSDYSFWLGVITMTGLANAETIVDFDVEGLNGAGGDGSGGAPPVNTGEETPPETNDTEPPFEPPPVPPIPESIAEVVKIVAWGAFLIAAMIVGSTMWKIINKQKWRVG